MDYHQIFMNRLYKKLINGPLPQNKYSTICRDNISRGRCEGSGYYSRTYNQICYRCEGKGWQSDEDMVRNIIYDALNRDKTKAQEIGYELVRNIWRDFGIQEAQQCQKFLAEKFRIFI